MRACRPTLGGRSPSRKSLPIRPTAGPGSGFFCDILRGLAELLSSLFGSFHTAPDSTFETRDSLSVVLGEQISAVPLLDDLAVARDETRIGYRVVVPIPAYLDFSDPSGAPGDVLLQVAQDLGQPVTARLGEQLGASVDSPGTEEAQDLFAALATAPGHPVVDGEVRKRRVFEVDAERIIVDRPVAEQVGHEVGVELHPAQRVDLLGR